MKLLALVCILLVSDLSTSKRHDRKKRSAKKYIYMTFDDGPDYATKDVLNALKTTGERATFFVNMNNIQVWPYGKNLNFVRSVVEGHVIGDHSFNHMLHNTPPDGSPRDAYRGVEDDIRYFGKMNSDPAVNILRREGLNESVIKRVEETMSTLVRQPYTDNWRVGNIRYDCLGCTIPLYSGRNGVLLADALHNQGKQVFGWDLEWTPNYATQRLTDTAEEALAAVNRVKSKQKNKIVLLSHDRFHREFAAPDLNGKEELIRFIQLAKQQGYQFRTLDTYLQD